MSEDLKTLRTEIIKLAETHHCKNYVESYLKSVDRSTSINNLIKARFEEEMPQQSCSKLLNASIYDYIFVTLASIYYYRKQLELKLSKKQLEIIILTTQMPSSFDNTLHNRHNPYYKYDIMSKYMELFENLTGHDGIRVKRYYICDDYSLAADKNRMKLFYSEDDLKTCLCPKRDPNNCYCLSCPRKINGCSERRYEFVTKNNTEYYYLPLSRCIKEPFLNFEIRELIAFKIGATYDMAITSNLMDDMSSLFLKFYLGEDINNSQFDFLGHDEMKCSKFLEETITKKYYMNLRDLWGVPVKGILF